MGASDTPFPECCRYCPHRTAVSGACGHEASQALATIFVDAGEAETCPVYRTIRAKEMRRLSTALDAGLDGSR